MPAKIIHPKHPKLPNHPNVSVVIPTLFGDQEKLTPLLNQIKKQTEKNIEIILSINEKPNGHARNVGVKKAKGKYLICLDDDAILTNKQIFSRLIKPLDDPKIGITGAIVRIPKDTRKLGRDFARARAFETPLVTKITDSDLAQHVCCALPLRLYRALGGESDTLITGTDNDLRYRVHQKGLRVVLVPKTLVYHRPPEIFSQIKKGSFNKGLGAMFALKKAPEIFWYPKIGPVIIKKPKSILLYFILTLPLKIILNLMLWRPGRLIFDFYQTKGLIYGYFNYYH